MIIYVPNFLNDNQIDDLMERWNHKKNSGYIEDGIYTFYYTNLKDDTEWLSEIIPEFEQADFKKIRIQMVNETISQVKESHVHVNKYSFIVFLNDNFKGGELVFEKSNVSYVPKKGDMIYFTGEESHKVNDCIGDRFTLVGFLHNELKEFKQNSRII